MPAADKSRQIRVERGVILANREKPLPLSQLRLKLPDERDYSTLWEWCVYGRRHAEHKRLVRMEAIRTTQGLASSVEAYWRFITKLNED